MDSITLFTSIRDETKRGRDQSSLDWHMQLPDLLIRPATVEVERWDHGELLGGSPVYHEIHNGSRQNFVVGYREFSILDIRHQWRELIYLTNEHVYLIKETCRWNFKTGDMTITRGIFEVTGITSLPETQD